TELTLSDISDPAGGKQLPIPPIAQSSGWLSVARNGAVAYLFATDKGTDLAIDDRPDAAPRVLTDGGNSYTPAITGDGKTIVFGSRRAGDIPHIFAMDSDGSNVRQLTHGAGEGGAYVSADGN